MSLVGASAALTISGIPFMGPIGAARVAYIDGEYVLNPLQEQMADTDLDMVVAGTANAVNMVESETNELSEDIMLGAVMFAHKSLQPVIDMIVDLAEDCAKEPRRDLPEAPADQDELLARVSAAAEGGLRDAYKETVKQARVEKIGAAKEAAMEAFAEDDEDIQERAKGMLKTVEKDIVRNAILDTKQRIDGRDLETVRPIEAEVGILPRAHGSALFTRGETQGLVTATLGTGQDEQIIDALEGEYREHFLLHLTSRPTRSAKPASAVAGTPGNRPRKARLAGDPGASAREGGFLLYDACGFGNPPNQGRPRWPPSAARHCR